MDRTSVVVQGITAICREQGSAGRPLLLIHGWGASAAMWRLLGPEMVPRARCLAPDLPGWGDSDKPAAPYTIEWYADWAADLLRSKYASAAAVAGHSMGAAIALALALRHPERVSRLVLVSPVVRGSDAFARETRLLALPGLRQLAYPCTKSKRALRFLTRNFRSDGKMDPSDLLLVARGTYASLSRSLVSLLATDLVPRLPEIRVPALVIAGGADRLVAPVQAELAGAIPGARVEVLPGVGHWVPLEAPERFNPLVRDFVSPATRPFRPPQW
ncbi:MAG: alpha/beta hydrolase [Planctomycetes bacterium]|nr:alpha/beta hydrolase [Planctomycetota bacterium]